MVVAPTGLLHPFKKASLVNQPRAASLRPARAQDATEMAVMSRELIETGLAWRYTPLRMAALIADPETVALVACDGSGIQGFAVMQFGDEHAHLALLCVRPAQQRQGTGRRLHEWLVESARVAGIVSIRLELRADNSAALAFYRQLGFTETQWVPGYYDGRVAARRMSLSLNGRPA
jgi:ribosomal protein S18 acetylase RimI-like enzyme